jgi:Flp pilus assembly pilin Flp
LCLRAILNRNVVIETVRKFFVDEAANATAEYALVATAFAFLIIGLMTVVTSEAGGQVSNIDGNLNNRNGITN